MTLPISDRADVAREVLQQPFKVLRGHVILDGDSGIVYWNPAFEGEDWMRSQALALVEKAFELLFTMEVEEHLLSESLGKYVVKKNVPALEIFIYQRNSI